MRPRFSIITLGVSDFERGSLILALPTTFEPACAADVDVGYARRSRRNPVPRELAAAAFSIYIKGIACPTSDRSGHFS